MKDDSITIFDTFNDSFSAHIVKSKLEANGIQCFLSDEYSISIRPLFNQALGGIKLNIFAKDAEAARTALME